MKQWMAAFQQYIIATRWQSICVVIKQLSAAVEVLYERCLLGNPVVRRQRVMRAPSLATSHGMRTCSNRAHKYLAESVPCHHRHANIPLASTAT